MRKRVKFPQQREFEIVDTAQPCWSVGLIIRSFSSSRTAIESGNGAGAATTLEGGIELILRILFGLVVLFFSCLAHAQNPAGKVMHRSGAGQLDSTGWTDATSTEGKFSVRLPGPFDDFTVRNSDETPQAGRSEGAHV